MTGLAVRFALIALVAAVGFGAWWSLLRDSDEPAPTTTRYLYRADQEAVTALEVTTEGASMSFVRGDEGWRFESNPLLPVNLDRWGGIVLLLSGPQVERTIPAPDDLATFGLAEPSTVIEVAVDGQDGVVVRLGDVTPDGQHYYAQVGDDEGVALVNTPWGNALRNLATSPPYPYWYYDIDPSSVRLFEVERGGQTVTLLFGLPGENRVSNRVVVNDVARDLTADEVEQVMDLVGGPSRFGIRRTPLPPDSVDPDITVRLTYVLADPLETRSSYSAVYRITNQDSGGAYLATTKDTEHVLEFPAAWVEAVLGLLAIELE
jgi:hypothetical protein